MEVSDTAITYIGCSCGALSLGRQGLLRHLVGW
jgi:hypothetical protein